MELGELGFRLTSAQVSSSNFRWTWNFFDGLVARLSAFSGSYLLAPPLREISLERPPGEIPSVPAISFWMRLDLASFVPVDSHRLSFSWSKTQVGNLIIPGIHFLGTFFVFNQDWIYLAMLIRVIKDVESCDGCPDASENGKFRKESYDFGIDSAILPFSRES